MVPGAAAFSHPVVLYVDADEEMTPALAREIRASLPRFEAGGAFVPFDYVFCGRKLRHGHRVYKLALLARDRSRFLDYDDLDVAHMGSRGPLPAPGTGPDLRVARAHGPQ